MRNIPSTVPTEVAVDRCAAERLGIGIGLDRVLAIGKFDFALFDNEVDSDYTKDGPSAIVYLYHERRCSPTPPATLRQLAQ